MVSDIEFSDKTLQKNLLDILDIINYKSDRDSFVKELTKLCLEETLLNVLEELSLDKKNQLSNDLKDKDVNDALTIVKNYIDPTIYAKTYLDTRLKIFKDYIATIIPTLSSNQKERLKIYLNSLEQ